MEINMYQINIPIDEIEAMVKDRNINIKHAILDYVDSIMYEHLLLEIENKLLENGLVRCSGCGYWQDSNKELFNFTCKDCREKESLYQQVII